MWEIDDEYSEKVSELEYQFEEVKMTNQKGEKINPNADLNSFYAFVWYANQDLCKKVIFNRVFKKK